MAKILVIDDHKDTCDVITSKLTRMGHQTISAYSLMDGLREAYSQEFDVVFLDVKLPDGNGLDALPRIRQTSSSPEVIIITGVGDPDGAELAIKSGAWSYIEKGSSLNNIVLPLTRALDYRKEKISSKPLSLLKKHNIIGTSLQMQACFEQVAQAASSDTAVLIAGETGSGKEVVAHAIHNNSARASKNFVVVDCAALPESLVEGILFGHEKGAYTGADKAQMGLIKEADGGTLFLDEVGELPLSIQKSFLRVLQERHFRPLGLNREIKSDFRLLAATNRDLDQMVQEGKFRQDLLYRLKSFVINLPPLRNRVVDIKELVLHYVPKLCERFGIPVKATPPDFLETLAAYNWPGNVRELINALETTIIAAKGDISLFPNHLPINIRIEAARFALQKDSIENITQLDRLTPDYSRKETYDKDNLPPLREARAAFEKQYLQDVMQIAARDTDKAAKISGISRSRLYVLLKKYDIPYYQP
ncbi:MAG: sigma-54-dependent Fis family transcriptional regulator [Deltaproteobacteria bacterium]|nr:sigma-54-dependent Fis family transcriptional regulator [Deltaproteobacteria bacterium]